jgi:hypothetical protein
LKVTCDNGVWHSGSPVVSATEEVTGSNPVAPTSTNPSYRLAQVPVGQQMGSNWRPGEAARSAEQHDGRGMAGMVLPRLRLEDLADARLDAIREPHLDRLIEAQIEEDPDLDFKSEPYGPKDGDKRTLAGDAAAMANTRGSAIVLGIGEVTRGRAGVL